MYDSIFGVAAEFCRLASEEWSFFVDMDETLLTSFAPDKDALKRFGESKSPNVKVVHEKTTGRTLVSIKRPGADAFLNELRQLGRVCLLTASAPQYAHLVLRAHGLSKHFDKIYTGEDLTGTPKEWGKKFLLIDNLPITSDLVGNKLQMLNYSASRDHAKPHFIRVPEFAGDLQDNALISVLDEIKERVSSKEASI